MIARTSLHPGYVLPRVFVINIEIISIS